MLTTRPTPAAGTPRHGRTTAVLGLGYVGLPTALALVDGGHTVLGVDVSATRRRDVQRGSVDLPDRERERLHRALGSRALTVAGDAACLSDAAAVIVCVPTPVDEHLTPDLGPLRAACDAVVRHAVPGQCIVLTSTSYVGCTRDLLVAPLVERGLVPGSDVHVAFSPERIDPGRASTAGTGVPRVVGGSTEACCVAATALLAGTTSEIVPVSSPEAAELAKLWENTFRAVNIALANECADIAGDLGLDAAEVVSAAATKPYGFMAFRPGPGVGGHCIPCDPHYLLWQMRARQSCAPLIEQAMDLIAERPRRVARRAVEVLASGGIPPVGAKVLLVGLTYKAGVADVRESPMLKVAAHLRRLGMSVEGHDPLLPAVVADSEGHPIGNVAAPAASAYDLVVLGVAGEDPSQQGLLRDARAVLDTTYQCSLETAERL